MTLPAQPTSAARARRFVSAALAEWDIEADDAVLVVSELVTNALLHARTGMTVRVAAEPGAVLLAVTDGSVVPPRERQFSVDSGTGRGLRLLDSMADEWGVETRPDGKTVWCRIPLDGAGAFAGFDIDTVNAL